MKMQKGFTFIEIIVAIFVIVVGIVGMYSLVPHILQRVSFNYNRFIASQLAAEGVEIIRNIREGNWLEQIETPENDWLEDLNICGGLGCEADYTVLGLEDPPAPNAPNWRTFNPPGRHLQIDNETGFYRYSGDIDDKESKFIRKIILNPAPAPGLNETTIEVTVYWGDQAVVVSEKMYNWR